MIAVVLVVHLFIAIALIGAVLVQRSEGGGLGIGGGSLGGLMTTRGSANLMTRITAVLAACFMGTSVLLAIMAGGGESRSPIIDAPVQEAPVQPPPLPSAPLGQ